MSTPQKKIAITVLSNSYEITYPTVGQLLDIDIIKSQLSGGRYEQLKYSMEPAFVRSAKRIDVTAYFNVLVPDLRKDILAGKSNTNSILNLSVEEFAVLEEVYDSVFLPWFELWEAEFNKSEEQSKG